LHVGNILNFALTYAWSIQNQAELFLRIDDADGDRAKDEYIQDIFDCLNWLGFTWQGPKDLRDFKNNFSQRLKFNYYQAELKKISDHLFYCDCSRKKIKEESLNGLYPGTCASKGLAYCAGVTSTRVNLPNKNFEQMILWRKDNVPAYQWFSLIEDRDQMISHIIRGEDLYHSSLFQKELSSLLINNPLKDVEFTHHGLLTNDQGSKLSKSKGAGSITFLKSSGATPDEILGNIFSYVDNVNGPISLSELATIPFTSLLLASADIQTSSNEQ
jgi:glutamyl-tRNA synthetase